MVSFCSLCRLKQPADLNASYTPRECLYFLKIEIPKANKETRASELIALGYEIVSIIKTERAGVSLGGSIKFLLASEGDYYCLRYEFSAKPPRYHWADIGQT